MKAKRKTHSLPDMRLAKAFGFTADDLAANRSGYLSNCQRGWLEIAEQHVFNWLAQRFGKENPITSEKWQIKQACGRAKLHHRLKRTMSMFHADVEEYHALTLVETDLVFPINLEQHHALSENILYHVYYEASTPPRIFSIERALDDCQESSE